MFDLVTKHKRIAQVILALIALPFAFFGILAERTGLEPATPGVTGRYSNQLNYRSNSFV